MSQRKLGRRPRRWPLRWRWSYRRAHGLHAYEERVVLALLIERGSGSVRAWCEQEPGRWDPRYLAKTFTRLRDRGLIKVTHYRRITGQHTYVPKPRPQPQEKAA